MGSEMCIRDRVNNVSLIEEKHFFKFLLISLSTTCWLKRGDTVVFYFTMIMAYQCDDDDDRSLHGDDDEFQFFCHSYSR